MIHLMTPQLSFELDELDRLAETCAQKLSVSTHDITTCDFFKKSLDVRHKHPRFQTTLSISVREDGRLLSHLHSKGCVPAIPAPSLPSFKRVSQISRICVVGSGPSGLFAALTLARAGVSVDIYERGKPVTDRAKDIAKLIHHSVLNPESNVCFGEGGAGTYSDGKLMTRSKSKYIPLVLDTFAKFGAKKDICYESHPHIGTDCLMPILSNIRQDLESKGVNYYFNTKVDDFIIRDGICSGIIANGERRGYDAVFLCVGHSADDVFSKLLAHGVALEPKPIAIGLRIEHPQELINRIQYGSYAGHPLLPPAEYAVRFNRQGMPSAFSFCMCPGGRVVASQTSDDTRVVNGMSGSLRNGRFANSAIVVQVDPSMYHEGPLGGLKWVRELERDAAKECPPAFAPAQSLGDFLARKTPSASPRTTYTPGTVAADLNHKLPQKIVDSLHAAFPEFDSQMRGFVCREANLIGIESRTSSPVRITRDESYQSVNTCGLFPLGEGAGYAGGITSCALDGIQAALDWLHRRGYYE